MNNHHSHSDSNRPTGDRSKVDPPSTALISKLDSLLSALDSQETTCVITCKQTETSLNTSTDDALEIQTKHDPQVVQYDAYDVVMCVWGFIRIHMEANNVIPESLKQLIVNFVGKYYFFLKMINHSEQEQIELKIHSHKGHLMDEAPENMLQSNGECYVASCHTNDWIIFSIDSDHWYYPTKVQVHGSLKNFRL
eukprot:186522_1